MEVMRITILSLLILTSCSSFCQIEFKPPLIVDSIDTNYSIVNEFEARTDFAPLLRDSDSSRLISSEIFYNKELHRSMPEVFEYDAENLVLYVDTTQKIILDFKLAHDLEIPPPPLEGEPVEEWKPKYGKIKTLPVFIYNPLDSVKSVETYDRMLPIIQEALSDNGEWLPIERWFIRACGNGVNEVLVLPKEYLLSAVYAYGGEYRTRMRLKLVSNDIIIYSNEFTGFINKGQFRSKGY